MSKTFGNKKARVRRQIGALRRLRTWSDYHKNQLRGMSFFNDAYTYHTQSFNRIEREIATLEKRLNVKMNPV